MNRPEQQLQQACVKWYDHQHGNAKALLYAVNNNSKNKRQGGINKSMGVRKGVADLCLMVEKKHVYIEVKIKGRYQSADQKEFEGLCISLGHDYYIIRSIEEFEEVVNFYIKHNT